MVHKKDPIRVLERDWAVKYIGVPTHHFSHIYRAESSVQSKSRFWTLELSGIFFFKISSIQGWWNPLRPKASLFTVSASQEARCSWTLQRCSSQGSSQTINPVCHHLKQDWEGRHAYASLKWLLAGSSPPQALDRRARSPTPNCWPHSTIISR